MRVTDMNDAAERMLGQSRRSLTGQLLSAAIYEGSDTYQLVRRVVETDAPVWAGAISMAGPLVSVPQVDIRLEPIEGGFVVAAIASMTRDGEAAAGMADFSRILGHEVKNPLAGISGAAQLLKRAARDDQLELLELIEGESGRIERLVTRLSAFELYSAPRRKAVNIHKLLGRILTAEAAAAGELVLFSNRYDPSLPDVYGDEDHLHEALQNIIRNAAEAADSHITVRTEFEAGVTIRPGGDKANAMQAMRVTVEDDGQGVSPEQEATMFHMFQTYKSGGTGLGLALVGQIVAAHDGQVLVDSQPGRMRMSIILPLHRGD